MNFFERVQFFLQRANFFFSDLPDSLSAGLKTKLWDIMAEVLSTLASFTKTMKEDSGRRFSRLLLLVHLFLTDYDTENILRGLVRRTDIEDVSLRRLDDLTKEERFILATTTLETAPHNDGGATMREPIRDVDEKVNPHHASGNEHRIRDKEPAVESRAYILSAASFVC